MHDKKIILALSGYSIDTSVFNLLHSCISGANIHLTVCILNELGHLNLAIAKVQLLEQFCAKESIVLRMEVLKSNEVKKLQRLSLFADLLIFHHSIMLDSNFLKKFGKHSCPVLILPKEFKSINNLLLTVDGTPNSIASIKQLAQLFASKIRHTDVTLVFFMDDDLQSEDELLLIEYLKQFSDKLGILKIKKPITNKNLKPIKCDDQTLVLNATGSLIASYNDSPLLLSLNSKNSIIFLPA